MPPIVALGRRIGEANERYLLPCLAGIALAIVATGLAGQLG